MEKGLLSRHISQQFNVELEDIRHKVLAMGGLVEKQVQDGLRALLEGDRQLAGRVARSDDEVNRLELSIDEECSQIIARRQPAASDLRLVLAVLKIITDLERIGDEAMKIGRYALEVGEQQSPRQYYKEIRHLGEHVKTMLHGALDAFARMDVQQAAKVAREEPLVDQEYEAAMRQLITAMMEDPRAISRALNVLWSARALERIADHARNVCEYVIYMVNGRDVRHQPLQDWQDLK